MLHTSQVHIWHRQACAEKASNDDVNTGRLYWMPSADGSHSLVHCKQVDK